MHVDMDDVPEHLKNRKKGKALHFLGTMAIGTAVIGLLAAVVSIDVPLTRLPKVTVVAEPQAVAVTNRTNSVEWQSYQPEVSRNSGAAYENTESLENTRAEPETKRQTVFNDQNYTPRGADNVLAFEEIRPEAEPIQAARKPKEIVVAGVQRDRANEICSYAHKEGSVEKRNCKARINLDMRN